MIIICGHIHVDPANLGRFMSEIKVLSEAVRQREGNYSYDIAVEDSSSGKLLITERWKDQSVLSTHLASSDTLAFIYRWQGRMKEELLKYDAFNERELMDP